ncbi:hypothetical protein SteCoe_27032 [Stentor coeruleus]|uniref:Uncharacterized protein n=1 Tax=Stentor coeruleus TaxID=5963 RepID=A0A1R2BBH4_9CILI|nr:hypothetical protein SteCoe_27032 [Stentor coeruleus]
MEGVKRLHIFIDKEKIETKRAPIDFEVLVGLVKTIDSKVGKIISVEVDGKKGKITDQKSYDHWLNEAGRKGLTMNFYSSAVSNEDSFDIAPKRKTVSKPTESSTKKSKISYQKAIKTNKKVTRTEIKALPSAPNTKSQTPDPQDLPRKRSRNSSKSITKNIKQEPKTNPKPQKINEKPSNSKTIKKKPKVEEIQQNKKSSSEINNKQQNSPIKKETKPKSKKSKSASPSKRTPTNSQDQKDLISPASNYKSTIKKQPNNIGFHPKVPLSPPSTNFLTPNANTTSLFGNNTNVSNIPQLNSNHSFQYPIGINNGTSLFSNPNLISNTGLSLFSNSNTGPLAPTYNNLSPAFNIPNSDQKASGLFSQLNPKATPALVDVFTTFSVINTDGTLTFINPQTKAVCDLPIPYIKKSSRMLQTEEGILVTGGSGYAYQAFIITKDLEIKPIVSLTHPRFWHCTGYIQGYPAVAVGTEKSRQPKVFVNTVEIYKNGQWYDLPSTNINRASAAMITNNNYTYLCGGVVTDGNYNNIINTIERFENNSWVILNICLPDNILSPACYFRSDNEIAFFGGEKAGKVYSDRIFAINVDNGDVNEMGKLSKKTKFTYAQIKKNNGIFYLCDFEGTVLEADDAYLGSQKVMETNFLV